MGTKRDREGGMGSGGIDDPQAPPSALARALAVLSLGCSALLIVLVVVFLARNGVYVAVGLVGVAIAGASGWWVITARSWRRVAGWAGMTVGALTIVLAVLFAGQESWTSVVQLVVGLCLLTVAVASAQASFRASLRTSPEGVVHHVQTPVHAVLLCNPWSGGGKVERFGLQEIAESLGVETVVLDHGLDLGRLARDAIGRGADCLGMAGGDGSQALVASLAVEHQLPFVCVSAGTRNHFALDLGLDRKDPRKSVHAFRDAIERRVDFATVNDRFFVNNVSLGVYATIVQQEGYREAKAQTTQQLLPELLGRQEEPFDLQFFRPDGTKVEGACLIMVSNNPYTLGPFLDVSQRRRLDSGQLGVFAVSARTGAQAAEVMTTMLAGRRPERGHVHQFTCHEFTVSSHSGMVYAGIDGEALELEAPLRFRIHPRGLRLLVPKGNIEASLRRHARDVHLKDLFSLAHG